MSEAEAQAPDAEPRRQRLVLLAASLVAIPCVTVIALGVGLLCFVPFVDANGRQEDLWLVSLSPAMSAGAGALLFTEYQAVVRRSHGFARLIGVFAYLLALGGLAVLIPAIIGLIEGHAHPEFGNWTEV